MEFSSLLNCDNNISSSTKLFKLRFSVCHNLKQTNLENGLHISTEIPKEDFNDNVFQYFVDELK